MRPLILLFLHISQIWSQSTSPTINITTPPTSTSRKTIKVGVAVVEHVQQSNIGWSVCGGAVSLAVEYLHKKNLLLDVDLQFFINYTECDPALAASVGVDFIKNKHVDAILGPPCPGSAYLMGSLSTFYGVYMISWGYVSDAEFGNLDKFTYLTTLISNSMTLAYSALKVLERFSWDRFSFVFQDNEVNYCQGIYTAIQSAMLNNTTFTSTMVYNAKIPRGSPAAYNDILFKAMNRSRIILVCFDSPSDSREFMYRANDNGMATDEYVFLMLSLKSTGFGQNGNGTVKLASGLTPFWLDTVNGNKDGKDASAKEAASRAIVLDLSSKIEDLAWMSKFNDEVLARVRGEPTFCSTPECLNNVNQQPGGFARQLHDAVFLYGITLTTAMKRDPVAGYRNGQFLQEGVQVKFNGLSGEVSMNSNTTRDPYYSLYFLDSNFEENSFMNITVTDIIAHIDELYDDEYRSIWATRGGNRPLSRPICGYSGAECPKTFLQLYLIYIIVGASVGLVVILIILLVVVFAFRSKQEFKRKQRAEWQIPVARLQKPSSKKDRNSKRSLSSNPSTITGQTEKSYVDTNYYDVFIYDKEEVMVSEHETSTMTNDDYDSFVKLRKLDHVNLNQFIGLSLDGIDYKVVWKYCSRSSLYDIITNGHMATMDAFFIYCVIKDIAEGLHFLHDSYIRCHGRLHSGCCLVNDGWQVKITDHGINCLKRSKKAREKVQLWVAPEHLRQQGASHAGDIYSFAIIASEVVNRKPAFDYKERKEGLDELLYLIKKGGIRPLRPMFDAAETDVSSALLSLIRDCWSEEPAERPSADVICRTLESMMPKENGNLIDHVFAKMEEYTGTLEMEVEDRTKELTAEKKKADILLSRMLPKQVAEKLKLGQTVQPEGFDSVSVMFMDIVKFTQLASKCSPLQVVSLLNELFSNFDGIIERHDVYKVESIGDGYLCVSGLPTKNGFRHIREIVEMALVLMDYVKDFRISHLPRERVELRVGVNSGPCVAGVVGLAMPRYCLFGDTVNTASRMESNGKANHIHLSGSAHELLIEHFGNDYRTESRGEVIIKGKGVMQTFWVLERSKDGVAYVNQTKMKTPPPKEEPIHEVTDDEYKAEAMYRKFTRQSTQPEE